MKHPVGKMILAIAVAAILLVPVFLLLRDASGRAAGEETRKGNEARSAAYSRMRENLAAEQDRLEKACLNEQAAAFRLEASALSKGEDGDSYSGPDTFEGGFVLRVRNGEAVYPAGQSAETLPLPEGWQERDSGYWTVPAAEGEAPDYALYSKVAGDAWAVKPVRGEEVRAYAESYLDTDAVIRLQEEAGSGPDGAEAVFSGGIAIVLNALALIAAAMITWHISVQRLVRNQPITKEQHKRFQPARVRRLAAACGLAGTAAVLLTALLYITLTSLRIEASAASDTLKMIESLDRMNEERTEAVAEREQDAVLYLARKAGEWMGANPALRNRAYLRQLAETADCEYVILYDTDGREILSDRDYTGFTLGSRDGEETEPFRRLLRGVETWVAEPATDEITGKELQKIGARVPMEGSDRYGALILALRADRLAKKDLLGDIDALLRTLAPEGAVCFAVDRETGTITHTSDESLKGMQASACGITERLMTDSDLCGISGNGKNWYGASRVIGQEVWFNCAGAELLSAGNRGFVLQAGGAALIYFAALLGVLLWGYTRKNYDAYARVGEEVVRGQTVEIVTADGRIKKTKDPTLRWGTLRHRWDHLDPGQKTQVVFQAALLAAVLAAVFLIRGSGMAGGSLTGFLLGGKWEHGINLFALAASIMVCGAVLLVILTLKLIVHFVCLSAGAKGETILKLLFNLAQYVLIFLAAYYTFVFFGIDTSALLGAMAFISLAISLGSQDLVSDILAGLSIVFAGEFQVGDIVEIDGYRGKVMEIGARSTKLMDTGSNVKIISNRNIRNVLNMTRYNSWYSIELALSSQCPLEKIEEILKAELPAIGEKSEKIISGPVYGGVSFIGKGWYRILILAECKEKDYIHVQRELNRELQLILSREDFPHDP